MKNCVYKDYRGEESIIGHLEDALWKATSFCEGPKDEGEYLTADGKGGVMMMQCTGTNSDSNKDLFDAIVNGIEYSSVEYYNGTDFREPTNDDLIKLYTRNCVWYDIRDTWADWGTEYSLTIYEGDAIPKYFLDTKLKGPIDSEIESNESVQVDLDYKPV